jgi:NodT family efflux transporter outer membrane factor (OMF) lipoprotein
MEKQLVFKKSNKVSWPKTCAFLWAFLWLSGCQVPKALDQQAMPSLPEKFPANQTDTAQLVLPDWRKVYFDSTLSKLIDLSIQRNFDLRFAMQRVEAYRSQVVLNKGIQLPDLNANVGLGVRRYGDYTMDGVGNYDTRLSPNINSKQKIPNPLPDYYLGLQSNWEVDLWGKLKNRKKAAAHRFLGSQMGKNLMLTSTIAEIASTYYELLALDNERKIYKENIALQQKAFEVVQVQKQTGMANELGVEIMEALLLGSMEKEVEVEQRIIELENSLNFLLGRYPQPIVRNEELLNGSIPSLAKVGLPSGLLRNRPDIRQAEFEMEAAKADVHSARVAFYPSLNIGLGLGLQAFNAALLLEAPASIAYNGLSGLAAPLLNRRVLKSQLLSAEVEKKQAYIQYEKTVVRSFTEVYTALTRLNNLGRMIEIKVREVATLKKSIITSGELFRTGRATYLEIVNAQKNALQSQLELVTLKKIQMQSSVELYRALGGGWQ